MHSLGQTSDSKHWWTGGREKETQSPFGYPPMDKMERIVPLEELSVDKTL